MAKEGVPSYWDGSGTSLASRISTVYVFSGRLNSSSQPFPPTSVEEGGKVKPITYIQGLHHQDTTDAIIGTVENEVCKNWSCAVDHAREKALDILLESRPTLSEKCSQSGFSSAHSLALALAHNTMTESKWGSHLRIED